MYKISVPLIAQAKSDSCWHASSMMIWRYWQIKTGRSGPMNTLIPVWTVNTGILPVDFINLAKKVGLQALPNQPLHTPVSLEKILKDHGPIWCAGYWFG